MTSIFPSQIDFNIAQYFFLPVLQSQRVQTVAEDTPVRGPRRFVTFELRGPFRNHLTYLLTYLYLPPTGKKPFAHSLHRGL